MVRSSFLKDPKNREKPKSEIKLIPILTADKLLSNLKNQWWIKKIEEYLGLPEQHFDKLYVKLIENFAEFVQILPAREGGKLGGLLSEALARSFLALKSLYEDAGEEKPHPRYAYALFSAALLLDIGFVIDNYKAMISDRGGRFVAEWFPHKGSMVGMGEYYKLRPLGGMPGRLHQYTAALFARQVLPKVGFSWIAEDARIFHLWLSILNEDYEGGASFKMHLQLQLFKLEDLINLDDFFKTDQVDLLDALETQEAEDFLAWLQEEIEEERMGINEEEGDIFTVENGLFVSMEVFRDFHNKFATYDRNYLRLAEKFNHLGLSKQLGKDFTFRQYLGADKKNWVLTENKDTDQTKQAEHSEKNQKQGLFSRKTESATQTYKEGIVIQNPGLVFSSEPPDPISKEGFALNAMEAMLPKILASQVTLSSGKF